MPMKSKENSRIQFASEAQLIEFEVTVSEVCQYLDLPPFAPIVGDAALGKVEHDQIEKIPC